MNCTKKVISVAHKALEDQQFIDSLKLADDNSNELIMAVRGNSHEAIFIMSTIFTGWTLALEGSVGYKKLDQ
jgi:hypothetical protein